MLIAFYVICSLNWTADVHRSTKSNSTKCCQDSQQQQHGTWNSAPTFSNTCN